MHDTQNKLGHPRARHAWRQLHPYTNLHGYMGLNASTATLTSRKKKERTFKSKKAALPAFNRLPAQQLDTFSYLFSLSLSVKIPFHFLNYFRQCVHSLAESPPAFPLPAFSWSTSGSSPGPCEALAKETSTIDSSSLSILPSWFMSHSFRRISLNSSISSAS